MGDASVVIALAGAVLGGEEIDNGEELVFAEFEHLGTLLALHLVHRHAAVGHQGHIAEEVDEIPVIHGPERSHLGCPVLIVLLAGKVLVGFEYLERPVAERDDLIEV